MKNKPQSLHRTLATLGHSVILHLLLTAGSSSLMAGGLYLNEFGTPSMGTAGAGAQALANDASTAFHNVAGMSRVEGEELMVSGGLLYLDMEFESIGGINGLFRESGEYRNATEWSIR